MAALHSEKQLLLTAANPNKLMRDEWRQEAQAKYAMCLAAIYCNSSVIKPNHVVYESSQSFVCTGLVLQKMHCGMLRGSLKV